MSPLTTRSHSGFGGGQDHAARLMGGKQQWVERTNEVKKQPLPFSIRPVRIAFGVGKRMGIINKRLLSLSNPL